MSKIEEDAGLIAVLLERLNKQRLPRLLSLIEKLEGGEALDDYDLAYLRDAIEHTRNIIPIIERNPEYQPLWTKVFELYKDISDLALQIEEASKES